ncbi:hypothetical protein EJD97_022979 [Solanum chilense]|uniref:Uncharacterized protein n=1 Tax=Solanum chilense TaxID=4083 RepID=A0A6N2AUX4_SOLCI|nr:hypothetical protein EJD97_022979 [Solanum chilense]
MPSTRLLNVNINALLCFEQGRMIWIWPENDPPAATLSFLLCYDLLNSNSRRVQTMGIGLFTTFFRLGYWANVQSSYYYLIIQMVAGSFQSTGSPSVVAMIRNWFSKENVTYNGY